MVYQGSKSKLAKHIVPIIQSYIDCNNIKVYVELFCGGANVADKVRCDRKICCDINDDLIALLKYVQEHPNVDIAPIDCSFEHYKAVRADKNNDVFSKEYRALIGYTCSYGGRYFDGGFGRNTKSGDGVYRQRLANIMEQAPLLKSIEFYCKNYADIIPSDISGCLFYLDPPYNGTKMYSKQQIDYGHFYKFCQELSENNIVIISEYEMPDGFECIWEMDRAVLQKSDRKKGDIATEKLFICGK